jgi:hypothetical protein
MPTQCTLRFYRSNFLAVTLENKKQYLLERYISFTVSVPVGRFPNLQEFSLEACCHRRSRFAGPVEEEARLDDDNSSLFQRLIPHRTQRKGLLPQQRQDYRCKAGFGSLKCRGGVVRFSFSDPANALFRREQPHPTPCTSKSTRRRTRGFRKEESPSTEEGDL